MFTILGILTEVLFTSVIGGPVDRILQRFWRQAFGQEPIELFVTSLAESIRQQNPQLIKYSPQGEAVSLDTTALENALNSEVSSSDRAALLDLEDDEFAKNMARIAWERQILIISGHTLDQNDYEQIFRNLLVNARTAFRRAVVERDELFREVILSEVQNDRREAQRLLGAFTEGYQLLAVRIEDIATKIYEIHEHLIPPAPSSSPGDETNKAPNQSVGLQVPTPTDAAHVIHEWMPGKPERIIYVNACDYEVFVELAPDNQVRRLELFHRGHRVRPVPDPDGKTYRFPKGTVWRASELEVPFDFPPQRHTPGSWLVVPPSAALNSAQKMWYTRNRIWIANEVYYAGGYALRTEMHSKKEPNGPEPQIEVFFYNNDVQVQPIIDEDTRTVRFP